MVNIKLESWWFLLENKVLFWATIPDTDYINLATEKWEDIINKKTPYTIVEFPGEYDIAGVNIKALMGKDQKLNYLINLKWKKYAFIQNPKILDEDEIGDMDYRLYLQDSVEQKIDQLELEWKKIKLDWENWALEVNMKDDKNYDEIDIKSSNTNGNSPEVEVD